MQKTKTQLVNLALSHIGEDLNQITAYATDTVREAVAARDLYEIAREEVLRAHDWSFNRLQADLTYIGVCPTGEWAYMYAYPSDCAIIHRFISGNRLETPEDKIPFEVASGYSTSTTTSITAITETTEGTVVVTSASHGLIFGDIITFASIGGATELNGNYYWVAPIDANNFIIFEQDTKIAVAPADVSAYTSGGTVTRLSTRRVIYCDVESTEATVSYGAILSELYDSYLPDYPHDYITAFTYTLAKHLALRLVRDSKGVVALMEREAKKYLDSAKASNNKEPHYGPRPSQSSFVTKRT